MSNLPKYSPCRWCNRSLIEKHHWRQHESKCFMSPRSIKLLTEYFQNSITNPKMLTRKRLHTFCVEDAKILSPVSMGNYFNQNKIKILIIQLLIMLYKYKMFDWEYSEIIIYHITTGNFYMKENLFNQLKQQVRDKRGLNNINTNQNYKSLINAIITRAKLDLNLVIGGKDENNEIITQECITDAKEFLQYMNAL